MRRLIITLAVLAVFVLPAWAQKIEIQKPDRNQIVRVQTALNHLTVIEVGETVTTVAAGSPAFKIEWRENKVFVQPIGARRNHEPFYLDGLRAAELRTGGGGRRRADGLCHRPPVSRIHRRCPRQQ